MEKTINKNNENVRCTECRYLLYNNDTKTYWCTAHKEHQRVFNNNINEVAPCTYYMKH